MGIGSLGGIVCG